MISKPMAAGLALVLLGGAAAEGGYRPATVWCTLHDPAITESSGLASASATDALLYTHNDSGDTARFFAVNQAGDTVATVRVTGAQAVDWEDMARGPGANGQPALYLGDIGDNKAKRKSIHLYRVAEPAIPLTPTGQTLDTEPAEAFTLAYEDGPRDAEALMVEPKSGQVYVASKSLLGSNVYAAPNPLLAGQTNTLHKIGSIAFPLTGATTPKEFAKARLCTGGDISPDGKRLILRTYAAAWEWDLPKKGVAAALAKAPRRVPLPAQPQGEGICYSRDGRSLFISTEGANTPIHQLRRK